jgi:hypothetical protein
VTRPFHPWCGREFAFVDRRLAWDEDRVSFVDENGEVALLSVAWTDVDPVDPFVVVAAGRCPFRVDDLLAVADLIDALRVRASGGWRRECRLIRALPDGGVDQRRAEAVGGSTCDLLVCLRVPALWSWPGRVVARTW